MTQDVFKWRVVNPRLLDFVTYSLEPGWHPEELLGEVMGVLEVVSHCIEICGFEVAGQTLWGNLPR